MMENRFRASGFARTCMAFVLVIVLSVALIPNVVARAQEDAADDASADAAGAAGGSDAVYEKSEVVYATLGTDGAVEQLYVVNRFDVTQAGTVVDVGDYSQVANLTDGIELACEGGIVSFEALEGTSYYQGYSTSADLPWDIAIGYELDGEAIDADQLAGASGELSIHVETTQNAAVDSAFFESFLLQVTFTLPGGAASGIQADGATVASSGEDTTVAFTVLPGNEGDLTLTAQVSDFSMDGIQFAALPYSSAIEMPDTSEMVDGMTELSDGIGQLAEGTEELADGVEELADGADSLSSGSASFSEGLDALDGSSADLVSASAQIQSALDQVAEALSGADFSQLDQLSELAELSDALVQLADGLDELQTQAGALQSGYTTAWSTLGTYLEAIPEGTLTESDLAALYGAVGTDNAALAELVETYEAAQAARAVYESVKDAFDGADTLLAALAADDGALATESAALRQMAASLGASTGDDLADQLSQLSELASGLEQLAGQYGQFHEGLQQYASGVSEVAGGYSQLDEGSSSLAEGVQQLADGASELSDGASELDESTSDLPQTMSDEIDELMVDYDFPEFDPVSFVSAENDAVVAVQFVLVTDAIEAEEEEAVEEEEAEETFLDRLLALFT